MRIDELTTFRFIAAAIVVVYHFGKDATGFGGILAAGPQMVTFFFVLSGFVLGVSYFKKDIKKKQFWWARAARIMPVYFLALAMSTLPTIIQGNQIDPISLVLNVSFLQSWVSPYPQSINSPSWSLSVEAFFYVSFPFILFVINKYNLSTVKVMALALTTWLFTQIILTVVLSKGIYGGYPSFSHDLIYYFPISHFCSFLIGISGAMWFINRQYSIRSNFLSMLLVGGTVFLVVTLINNQIQITNFLGIKFPFCSSFFAPLFLALIIVISICRSKLVKTLGSKPLVLLGEASFSLYILQVPIHNIYSNYISGYFSLSPSSNFAAYFCFLTAISICSFLLLEKPANKFLRYTRFPEQVANYLTNLHTRTK